MSDELVDFDILDISLRQPSNTNKDIMKRRLNPKREHIDGAYQEPPKGLKPNMVRVGKYGEHYQKSRSLDFKLEDKKIAQMK